MSSCSNHQLTFRNTASSPGNCVDLVSNILDTQDRHVDDWAPERIAKIFDNDFDLDVFYRYIDINTLNT